MWAKHLEDWKWKSFSRKASDCRERSRSIRLQSSPHCSVVVKLGPHITGTSNSWNSFMQGHYAWSWPFAGRIEWQTKKCWTELVQQASSQCCWRLSYAGLALLSERPTAVYPGSCCMVSWNMAHANEAGLTEVQGQPAKIPKVKQH